MELEIDGNGFFIFGSYFISLIRFDSNQVVKNEVEKVSNIGKETSIFSHFLCYFRFHKNVLHKLPFLDHGPYPKTKNGA